MGSLEVVSESSPPPPPPPPLPSHPSWPQSSHPPIENTDLYDVTVVGRVGKYRLGELMLLRRAPTEREIRQWGATGGSRAPGADLLFEVVALGRQGQWQERAGLKFYAPFKRLAPKPVTI